MSVGHQTGAPQRTSQYNCAAPSAARTAAALYLVDVASPPTNPAAANHRIAPGPGFSRVSRRVRVDRAQEERE